MNDSNEPMSDEVIERLLAPLRDVACSKEVQQANRHAIEQARASRASAPWWRRTVAVPVPLAVAASLALVITAAASLWPAIARSLDAGTPHLPEANVTDVSTEIPRWSITRSYILSIESLAKVQDAARAYTMEERNDS
jgi:hypothetical protein